MPLFTRKQAPREVAAPASPRQERPDTDQILPAADPALEDAVGRIGRDLLHRARKKRSGVLSGAFWSDKLMDWAMKDEQFKVQLFRFVDTFPTLQDAGQVHDHLVDYLSQDGVTLPAGLGVGLKAGGLLKGAMSKTITGQINAMAERFIAGTDAASAQPMLRKYWTRGLAFSVDLLGETCVSESEANSYQDKYLDLITRLSKSVQSWPANERLERDHLGAIPRTNVSIKITALHSELDPIDYEGSIGALMNALAPMLTAAGAHDVFINFDMEHHALKDLTLDLFMRCCEKFDFAAGIAMQAYLRSGDDDARRIVEWSRRAGRQVTVRLVKGAYWDYETIHAEEMNWPIPVWSRKADTDACFERMSRRFIASTPRSIGEGGVKLAVGSHNARSIAYALAHLEQHRLPTEAIELQMLHGMAEELKFAAVEMGLRVREYVPIGEMIPGMAYLVRRLLENTSNESWLRAGFYDGTSDDHLLASPHHDDAGDADPGILRIADAPERHQLTPAVKGVGDERPFMNEPHRNFAFTGVRASFSSAVAEARIPEVRSDATEQDADRALAIAQAAIPRWRGRAVRERSKVLISAARIMRERRDELAGIMIHEAGKTWREADAEVCEAIDFCEYYARMAVPMFEPLRLGRFAGELDHLVYQPRGVAVVISPWNFPLAILCGMTTAALVTGNPTIIKPPRATLGIARTFHQIMLQAGCPEDVLHFVAGPGRTVGSFLVRDRRTALIAFTGSLEVGLEIISAAGEVPPGQTHVKKVISEMGGKNAIIIDASADLDEAVLAVRQSAFGYQGQKCSACSRAIVVESSYDTFLARLCDSTRALKIGDPADPSVEFGPVIDAGAKESIERYIEIGKREAHLACAMDLPVKDQLAPGRHYVAPHIFSAVAPDATIAREEIFGPVLSVLKVRNFDDALSLANASRYRLTGGVFSRKPSNIDKARAEFRVGNLYINRHITGAIVGRQPFGGFGLSGVGTKAGGPEYLLHFAEPRSICENTMRSGFAP